MHALQGKLQNSYYTVTRCHVTHDLFCVTKYESFGWREWTVTCHSFVSGKSISEGPSWHVPDSPSCPKRRYKQMGGDRNVQPIPSDSSTPYKPAYVSLDPTESITHVHELQLKLLKRDFGVYCMCSPARHIWGWFSHGDIFNEDSGTTD